jgi:uncharacterized membrane protein (UPF0127 family)
MMLLDLVMAVAAVLGTSPAPLPYCTYPFWDPNRGSQQPVQPGYPLTCRAYTAGTPKAKLGLAVAVDEGQREEGLMEIRRLPPRAGMIFAFPDGDAARVFWMKNTLIPLDMVFVKADGTVSGIARNVPATTPSTPDQKIPRRGGVGAFVIELRAGEADRDGIAKGVHLALPALGSQ